jgi:hypothetical protein
LTLTQNLTDALNALNPDTTQLNLKTAFEAMLTAKVQQKNLTSKIKLKIMTKNYASQDY